MTATMVPRRCLSVLWPACLLLLGAPRDVTCFSQGAGQRLSALPTAVSKKPVFYERNPDVVARFMVATGEQEIEAASPNLVIPSPLLVGNDPVIQVERAVIHSQQGRNKLLNILDEPSLAAGRALILAAAAIYGTNFATVKLLEEQVPMAVSASLRFTLAAAAVGGVVLMKEEKIEDKVFQKQRWYSTLAGMEVGAWYCIGYLCQALGLHAADASKSAFFNALAVIVVPLLDSFFRGLKLSTSRALSVLLALAGVSLLQLGPNMGGQVTMGDLYCLAQALFFGIGYWRLESATAKYPTQAARSTAGQLVAVALGSIGYMLTLGGGLPSLQSLQGWLTNGFVVSALLWTGLVSTALALYLETVALKVVSAAELTVLMTSVSLWGSAFAFVTMGETMSVQGLIGGLMILGGCILSSAGENPPTQDEKDNAILEP